MRTVEGPAGALGGAGALRALGSCETGALSEDGLVRRTELQPGGARATWHRQEPPVSADLALLAPHLGRQGHRGEDVCQQRERSAGASLSVRRRLLRRD